jgi:hypothetical protein
MVGMLIELLACLVVAAVSLAVSVVIVVLVLRAMGVL